MKLKSVLFGIGLAAVCAAGEALASYGTFTWCGKGADNNWSTAKNWVGGVAPGGWDYAVFPAGTNWSVNIPSDTWQNGVKLPDGEGTLTITGKGTLYTVNFGGDSNPASHINVGVGRKLVVDGLKVWTFDYLQRGDVDIINGGGICASNVNGHSHQILSGDAKLTIADGSFYTSCDNYTFVSNRAEVILMKGKFHNVKGVKFYDKSRYVQTGGSYIANNYWYTCYVFEGSSQASILGGMVRWIDSCVDSAWMPPGQFSKLCPRRGGRIVCPQSDSKYGWGINVSTAGGSFPFAGEVYVTNRTSATSGQFRAQSYAALTGGGDLYANQINLEMAANEGTSKWNLGKICLGAGGIAHNDHSSFNYYFQDGTTFGAFADWSFFNGPDCDYSFHLEGPLVFDTLNCFGDTNEVGEVKSHTISGSRLNLATATEFAAKGGGTVDIQPKDSPVQLRTLEVAAGTTVVLTNRAMQLKVLNLKLGANATLKINRAKGSYVDASGYAEFGAGAKLVVTALPTLDAGKRYPILMLPAKKGGLAAADFPTIEFETALPDGWSLGYLGNSAFLTDGKGIAVSETLSWTGAGGDNKFQTAKNWTDSSAPGAGSAPIRFYGTTNTVINNATAKQQVGNFLVGSSAGPFILTNNSFRFRYPMNDAGWTQIYYSLRHNGAFPFVIEGGVGTDASNSLGLQFQAYAQGSAILLGDSISTIPFRFGGDVRLGGAYTATRLYCTPNYGATYVTRRSSLTVMSGAKLSVTAQTGSQHDTKGTYSETDFFYAVATNGEMTVDGDDFTFTRAAMHFVDGTLKVLCPFATTAKQTFRGDGTLGLAQFAANASGSVRLEGNLTLVPGDWPADLPLALKDNVTVAPVADWTCAATNLVLDDHSTLTIATGGHRVSFATNIVSSGEIVVTGAGSVRLGRGLTKLWKFTTPDGAAIGIPTAGMKPGEWTDFLAIRRPGDTAPTFAKDIQVRSRYDVYTDSTVYSARAKFGLVFIVR